MSKKDTYTHGFKTPEGYFDEVEKNIMSKLKLESLPKDDGFKVPDGYFDTLEDCIQSKLAEENSAKVIPLFAKKWFKLGLPISASLLLMMALIFNNDREDVIMIEDLQLSTIENYISEDMRWDSYDIAAIAEEGDFKELTTEYSDITDEGLEEYILNNLDDTTLIIEQE